MQIGFIFRYLKIKEEGTQISTSMLLLQPLMVPYTAGEYSGPKKYVTQLNVDGMTPHF